MCGPKKMKITEAELEEALDSRSDKPIYRILKKARVGIAGLGGLGSNIASALVRNGVGHLVIADFDVVELSNINRQLYTLSHVGMEKAPALKKILSGINPFCEIEDHVTRVTEEKLCFPAGERIATPVHTRCSRPERADCFAVRLSVRSFRKGRPSPLPENNKN